MIMKGIGEIKNCLFCGKELIGRSDKKFCDDGCRNNYGYQRNKCDKDIVNKINKSLLYNRNVLKSIAKHGKKIVRVQILVNNNFNFDVMTGIYKTCKHHEYKLLYDYAYRYINDDEVLVLKCC